MPSNVQTPNIQYQRPGLSPEAKSTLMTGAMASVLGATWLAPTKIGGADNLLGLSQDKFDSATKQIAALKDEAAEKQALNEFKKLREALSNQHVKQAEELFGTAKEIKVEDIFKGIDKRITSPERAETALNMFSEYRNKIFGSGLAINTSNTKQKGITEEAYQIIDKLIPKKGKTTLGQFKQAFKNQFPIGSTPTQEELGKFFDKYLSELNTKIDKLSALKRVADCAENGVITRAGAEKAFMRYNKDVCLEEAKSCFEMMKTKLPKARFKSAAKWFGLGILISIASNIVFGFLGSTFGKKK